MPRVNNQLLKSNTKNIFKLFNIYIITLWITRTQNQSHRSHFNSKSDPLSNRITRLFIIVRPPQLDRIRLVLYRQLIGRMHSNMPLQLTLQRKTLLAIVANKRLFARMDRIMLLQCPSRLKPFQAHAALIRTVAAMALVMLLQVGLERERFIAVFADVWSLSRMEKDMLFEVTLACESFMAYLTIVELLHVGMDPPMLLQLGFCLEALHADGAYVRFLPVVD